MIGAAVGIIKRKVQYGLGKMSTFQASEDLSLDSDSFIQNKLKPQFLRQD